MYEVSEKFKSAVETVLKRRADKKEKAKNMAKRLINKNIQGLENQAFIMQQSKKGNKGNKGKGKVTVNKKEIQKLEEKLEKIIK